MEAKAYQRCLNVVLAVFLFGAHFMARGEKATLLHKDQSSPSSWQWLTRFEFGTWSGWSQDGKIGSYTVCDLSETATNDTNSWLVSEYVDLQGANEVEIGLTFMIRQCPLGLAYCKHSFDVYVIQTEGPLSGGITKKEIESGNFTLIESVNATYLWTPATPSKINQANMTFAANSGGAYFAFQDTGACLALTSVTLSYAYCSNVVNHGVVFKTVAAPSSSQHNITVNGNCSDKAIPYPSNSTLALVCLSSGQWVMDNKVTCRCTAGYELVGDTCTGCKTGYYKESIGNGQCIACPSNSVANPNHDSCPCQNGFYRAPKDAINDSCTAPPSEPRDINVTVVTDSVVIATWSRPAFDGGRTDVKYDLRCNTCSNIGSCSSNCSGVQFWPSTVDLSTPHVTISNLNYAVLYNITVTSKNGVSDQAGSSSLRYLHKTFSLTKSTTSTSTTAVTAPTTTGGNHSQENLTTVEAAISPVQGTASSQVSAAIGISVAVTFVVCFLIAVVVIILLMKFWRRKHFDQQSAQSSSTQLTELSRCDTPLKRMRTVTASTELTDVDDDNFSQKQYDHERSDYIPTINIENANNLSSRPDSAGSNHSLPFRKHRVLPAIDWKPPRSITPVLLPGKMSRNGLDTRHSVSSHNLLDSPRKSPEGSEHDKPERSVSTNSWFPAMDVQYNV